MGEGLASLFPHTVGANDSRRLCSLGIRLQCGWVVRAWRPPAVQQGATCRLAGNSRWAARWAQAEGRTEGFLLGRPGLWLSLHPDFPRRLLGALSVPIFSCEMGFTSGQRSGPSRRKRGVPLGAGRAARRPRGGEAAVQRGARWGGDGQVGPRASTMRRICPPARLRGGGGGPRGPTLSLCPDAALRARPWRDGRDTVGTSGSQHSLRPVAPPWAWAVTQAEPVWGSRQCAQRAGSPGDRRVHPGGCV